MSSGVTTVRASRDRGTKLARRDRPRRRDTQKRAPDARRRFFGYSPAHRDGNHADDRSPGSRPPSGSLRMLGPQPLSCVRRVTPRLLTPHPVVVGIETVGIASADANRPAEVRAVEVRRRWGQASRGYATAPSLRPRTPRRWGIAPLARTARRLRYSPLQGGRREALRARADSLRADAVAGLGRQSAQGATRSWRGEPLLWVDVAELERRFGVVEATPDVLTNGAARSRRLQQTPSSKAPALRKAGPL